MGDVAGVVAQLYRFPVKSMQGGTVERLELAVGGVAGDRILGVLDIEAGKVLSAKRTGVLLDASAELYDHTGTVTITLPDGSSHDAGDPATNAALSAWLDRDVRLTGPTDEAIPFELTMDPTDDDSEVWDFATPPNSLVDLAGVHVLTTSSLRVASELGRDADWSIHRFRPTVFVDTGDADGFVEDAWVGANLGVGTATLDVFMPTMRCAMPTRPQARHGLARDVRISRALTDGHSNNLGVYCAISAPGVVAIGDPVAPG